ELAPVIDAALETVRPAGEAKGITLRKNLNSAVPAVQGDSARLQQVIWNLLSNAVKFTPQGGQVEVALSQADGFVRLTVSDTGIGINSKFLPHVFERFRQADSSTIRRHGGLGLGLAIVKHIVELHGGSVWADSPGLGAGTSFHVSLPIASALP